MTKPLPSQCSQRGVPALSRADRLWRVTSAVVLMVAIFAQKPMISRALMLGKGLAHRLLEFMRNVRGSIKSAKEPGRNWHRLKFPGVSCRLVIAICLLLVAAVVARPAPVSPDMNSPGAAGIPYPDMPLVAPIGVRIGKHLEIPDSAKGPFMEPSKGYRIQKLGANLYMITDNVYQSMFLVYETGVVVVDAPPSYAGRILEAIKEVTGKPVTHIVYSHSHIDHIGGTTLLGGNPIIIAQEETKLLLLRANDPHRPIPTITFRDKYTLRVGSQILELSYHGNAHEPGNIFIYAPLQKTLMAVDLVFPGWMPWRQFALAQDIPGYFAQVAAIDKLSWDTLVSGHVTRTGTHKDVELQLEFMNDLRNATLQALKATKPGEFLAAGDIANPWAVAENYVDRVVIQCVNQLTPKWSTKLAGFDVFIWEQCYAMEESLRMDEQ